MIYNFTYKTILIRISIILLWIAIIFGFLLFPGLIRNSKLDNSINVLAWSGMYDLNYISNFEQKTGIKVRISYYESNEELLVKLRTTKGKGYDLIIPGDYAVHILKNENLLKKLDKSKLEFLPYLNPILLGHYYDKNNEYSLPAEWAVFGLGINKEYFEKHKINIFESWSLVFDNKYNYKIAMANDPLVSIPIASLYLFGDLNNLNIEKLEKIKELLIKQKKYIEAYAEFRPDYYLTSKSAQIAVSSSAYIFRALQSNNTIDFIIPQEGTLVTIENFALPKRTKKENLVYKFLNFLMDPQTVKHHFENEQALFPVTTNVFDQLDLKPNIKKLLTIGKESFNKFHFLRIDKLKAPVNEEYLRELWITIKTT